MLFLAKLGLLIHNFFFEFFELETDLLKLILLFLMFDWLEMVNFVRGLMNLSLICLNLIRKYIFCFKLLFRLFCVGIGTWWDEDIQTICSYPFQ
jgi:hypothetical protein